MSDLVGNPEDRFSRVAALISLIDITKTCLCNIQRIVSKAKIVKFNRKKNDIFIIFTQNIDCGYM